MTWTPLSTRLSGLPHVLSGPILRETTVDKVLVWIALKSQKNLSLAIFNGSENDAHRIFTNDVKSSVLEISSNDCSKTLIV